MALKDSIQLDESRTTLTLCATSDSCRSPGNRYQRAIVSNIRENCSLTPIRNAEHLPVCVYCCEYGITVLNPALATRRHSSCVKQYD